jgi:outer membrane lipoprotein-sorting protein
VKKSCALVLSLAVVLLAGAGLAQAMDADELIAKNLEAMGGKDKLQALQTTKAIGKFLIQGMEIPFTMTQQRPNLLRIDAEAMGMSIVQAYDGEKGWSINPMAGATEPQLMGENENKAFKLQADMDGGLVNYAEKGYTVEYLGEEDVEGTPCHKMRLDTKQDIVIDMFMDKEYFLLIKMANTMMMDENKVETQTYMSDFQEVNGLVVPFAIETRMGDMVVNQIQIEAMEQNVEVDPTIFVMPEKETPPEPPVLKDK